jgi:hypothetical protein
MERRSQAPVAVRSFVHEAERKMGVPYVGREGEGAGVVTTDPALSQPEGAKTATSATRQPRLFA